ncbi:hypothetical protein V7968_32670 [Nocardia vulneris]|uniref:hypothetical protein n=1 Tax=Nocardia vulneris TaxID=1141657 RepID=UPI0030CC1283
MTWAPYQQHRLGYDKAALRQHFPGFTFHRPTGDTCVLGTWFSNTGRRYDLRVAVPPGYPDECPSTYITYPTPLRDWTGVKPIESYGTSHSMHVWQTDMPGWVKICTYRPESWSAAHSMVKIVRKGLLWIVAYECHLQDGTPLMHFLLND